MGNARLPKILQSGEIINKHWKKKVGCPHQNYRPGMRIEEDLKLFKIWNESPQFGSLPRNREQWRKLIHKGADNFQISRVGKKKK